MCNLRVIVCTNHVVICICRLGTLIITDVSNKDKDPIKRDGCFLRKGILGICQDIIRIHGSFHYTA